jgi:hypothetical protein
MTAHNSARPRAFVLCLAAFLIVAGRAPADITYNQPSDFNPNDIHAGSYFSSLVATNGNPYTAIAYENFAITGPFDINRVDWQGGYVNPNTPAPVSGFTIGFWADGGGQPGALLLSQTIPGTADETFVGSVRGVPTYDYGTPLATPFTAGPGSYWISIQANLAVPPEWAWHTGTGGDSRSLEVVNGNQTFSGVDLAFTLDGEPVAPVPEPSTLALFGVGAVGLLCFARHKREVCP